MKNTFRTTDRPAAAKAQGPAPGPLRLFGVFFSISALTIGGGYAMVPVIGSALEKRRWVGEAEFLDLFAVAQSFPGPLAFTTALIAGRRLAGVRGALAAGLGVLLPPFGAIVLVGAVLARVGQLAPVKNFLAGAGATVPGLVAATIWKMTKTRKWTVLRAAAAISLAVLLCLLPGLTLPVFFGAVALLYLAEIKWSS
jgi:chromate transporter